MSSAKKIVVFIHIPKTAGYTLRTIFRYQYNPEQLFLAGTNETISEFFSMSMPERMLLQAFVGHVHFGVHDLFPHPTVYITMLREPIERVISYYYHRFKDKDRMPLEKYIVTSNDRAINNFQTRLLNRSKESAAVPYGTNDRILLENAKKNLEEHFSLVGITEYFDESLVFLKRELRWKMPFYIKLNVTEGRPKRSEIPENTLALIEEYNQLDIELYQYILQSFRERVSQQGMMYHAEVALLKAASLGLTRFVSLSYIQPIIHAIFVRRVR